MWSWTLGRHDRLKITDLEGGANVGLLLYNRDLFLDRLNLPDTLKAQHTAKITTGHTLMSDMGRVLCSVVEDSTGWNDPICGHSHAKQVEKKFGSKTYQEAHNEFYRNAHDCFLVELGKWGMGKPDLVANLNLFSKVAADDDGGLNFAAAHSKAGDFVVLRAEMKVLVVLNTCMHPLDPRSEYAPSAVKLELSHGEAPGANDPCRISRPENGRAFELTEQLFL